MTFESFIIHAKWIPPCQWRQIYFWRNSTYTLNKVHDIETIVKYRSSRVKSDSYNVNLEKLIVEHKKQKKK